MATTEVSKLSTLSLPLAAAILSIVEGSQIDNITEGREVDGKRVMCLSYPASCEAQVKELQEKYGRRKLTVNLYDYNQTLNNLRDALKKTKLQ